VEHAGLQSGSDLDDDFAGRLGHASDGDFGSIIQMIRDAAEIVMTEGRSIVEKSDFAAPYDAFTGCTPGNNIFNFDSDGWANLRPLQAYARPEDHDWRSSFGETAKRRSKRKTVALGDRPHVAATPGRVPGEPLIARRCVAWSSERSRL